MRTFQTQAELHAKSQSDYQNLERRGRALIQDFEDHLDRLTMQKGTGQSVDFFIKTLRDAIAKLQKNVSADAQRAAYHAAIASKYEHRSVPLAIDRARRSGAGISASTELQLAQTDGRGTILGVLPIALETRIVARRTHTNDWTYAKSENCRRLLGANIDLRH